MASLLLGAARIPAQSFSRISYSQSQTLGTSLSVSTSSLSVCSGSSPSILHVSCGRGDKKTERGKRFNHSFGTLRPRHKKGRGPPRPPVPPSPPRKDSSMMP